MRDLSQLGTTAAPWSAARRSLAGCHDEGGFCWMRIGLEPAPLPPDISDPAGRGAAGPVRSTRADPVDASASAMCRSDSPATRPAAVYCAPQGIRSRSRDTFLLL